MSKRGPKRLSDYHYCQLCGKDAELITINAHFGEHSKPETIQICKDCKLKNKTDDIIFSRPIKTRIKGLSKS